MRLGTIIGLIGLIAAALGVLLYWQIMRVAVALAGMGTGGPDLNRSSWYAMAMVGLGLAIFFTCVVMNLVARDRDA